MLGEKDEASAYTVKLYFIEFDPRLGQKSGFQISLQGETVQTVADPVGQAGGLNRPLVVEFAGVNVERTLSINLATTDDSPPLLAAIEVSREE